MTVTNPYLICLDLDGTLLNDDKEISTFTKQVLLTLQEQGHHLMIATGRPYRACDIYYHELNMHTPIVNFNGAYVHHPNNPHFKTIHEELDLDVAYEMIRSLKKYEVSNLVAEIRDHVYIDNYDERLFEGFSMGNPDIEIGNLLENLQEPPTSLLVESPEDQIQEIREMLNHFYAENIEHRRWGAPFPIIEIVRKGINKARGIDYVKSYLGIKSENVIAFGDEDNDSEMLKYATHGVAMANGLDEIKEIANEITYSNNEDGIGRYLNTFFNLQLTYSS
ncbi:Cof-type HAD-IIB family hydrolase [Staphylococcus sp. SQ8-PEA]|uniref:Cof-type HAD-IIB family hydrolase n=1 Tax=Staphylococcus marylandisciuri TaxID=2981529 RepID=A0ABT2QPS3_9STAP|nr:Cof-type HAD-IIB family hydrolase [Staphylococcus marylandisciuri]MCU5745974.1 Cof-type HAD-IIB family hydrolase [Staphylococcus marylandisciuri]